MKMKLVGKRRRFNFGDMTKRRASVKVSARNKLDLIVCENQAEESWRCSEVLHRNRFWLDEAYGGCWQPQEEKGVVLLMREEGGTLIVFIFTAGWNLLPDSKVTSASSWQLQPVWSHIRFLPIWGPMTSWFLCHLQVKCEERMSRMFGFLITNRLAYYLLFFSCCPCASLSWFLIPTPHLPPHTTHSEVKRAEIPDNFTKIYFCSMFFSTFCSFLSWTDIVTGDTDIRIRQALSS